MVIKRDEMFNSVRWFNFIVGVLNVYLYVVGGGYHLLGLGILNISLWVFTRK